MGTRVGVLLLAQLLVRAELEMQDLKGQDLLFPGFQNSSLLTSPCGHPTIRPLVIGGKDSLHGRWPWQASLRLSKGHTCGGSLLNRRWVLSAAHCFEKLPHPTSQRRWTTGNELRHRHPSEWTVQLGELSAKPPFWNLWAFYHRYKVQDIFMYPYFRGFLLNDIALLRLSSSVTYNKYIKPICVLASSVDFQNRTDCWATGWGDIKENQEFPSPYILQEVQVSIINNSRCNQMFQQPNRIWDDMICAGFENGSYDTCRGDSGGPLTCEENGLWYQIGIVSWGIGCGRPNRPGVYTNVSRYFNWIRMIMAHSTPRPDPCPLLLLLALLWAALLVCSWPEHS